MIVLTAPGAFATRRSCERAHLGRPYCEHGGRHALRALKGVPMKKDRKRPEGAPADQRWETDGGSLEDAGTEAESDAAHEEKRRRKTRWRAAKKEHWHTSDSTDETKRRDLN